MNRKERRASQSSTPLVHVNLPQAFALYQSGQFEEAMKLCELILKMQPTLFNALYLSSAVAVKINDYQKALIFIDKAIKVNPQSAEAYSHRGLILQQRSQWEAAIVSYDRAIALKPDVAEAHNNRGIILNILKQYEAALASYDKAIAIHPDYADAHNNRGIVLNLLGRYNEAIDSYDKAIAIRPDYPEAYHNRGLSLFNIKCYSDAVASYDTALHLKPNYVKVYYNRGVALCEMGKYKEAEASYDKALAIDANYADAHCGKAIIKLTQGQYQEGWKLHEWRWKSSTIAEQAKPFKIPLWIGKESLANKSIFIYAEQGLGDTIQFCRYVPMVEALGANITFAVPDPLVNILSTLQGKYHLLGQGTYTYDCDFHCPLMSLPLAFGTTLDTIPANIPYLHVGPDKKELWQKKLGNKVRRRIGLVWSGNVGHANDYNRSIPLRFLSPLLDHNFDFHSLQTEVRADDRNFLVNSKIIHHVNNLHDFSDTAALIAEMDLVISVDTSVAHLAGALGKPVWILISFRPDWRWLLDREDSPWYPTARLFRQQAIGDWAAVIARVKAELALLSLAFL